MEILNKLNLKHLAIVFFLLFQIAIVFFLNYNKIEKESYILNEQNLRLKVQYEAIKNNFKRVALTIFDGILNKKEVIDIFKNAHLANENNRVNIRRELYALLKDDYEKLSKSKIKQLHFHLPNGESFLRFHLPSEYGDNLFDIRYSIRVANLKKSHIDGFEVGRHYSSYRFVCPMYDENKIHIGSVETAIPFLALMTQMNKAFPTHIHFIVKKDIIESKIIDYEKINYKDSSLCTNSINDFLCEKDIKTEELGVDYSSLHSKVDIEIVNKIDKIIKYKVAKELNSEKAFSIYEELNGKYYIASFLPIKDTENKTSAYIISYTESKELKHLIVHFSAELFLLTIFNLMFILFLYKTIKMIDLKRKEEHLRVVSRELEERVKDEIAKNREKDRVMFSQAKYAQMGEMLSMIAHQWRQPLNAISTASINLTIKNEFGELNSEFLNEQTSFIQKETQKMSKVIDNFINFFHSKSEKEEFNLVEVLSEIELLIGTQLKNRAIKFEYRVDSNLTIVAFRDELKQVFMNLLINARDAFSNSISENKSIWIESFIENKKLLILIKDNAVGIDEKVIDRIFEPYFSTKEDGKGIGLYMTKNIVENVMDGKISVENCKNDKDEIYVVFKIELPIKS